MKRLLALLPALALAGCFASSEPLIPADKAVFTFEKIEYREKTTNHLNTLVHEGDYYVGREQDGELALQVRLAPVGDDLYVVEAKGEDEANPAYLHALLKVDLANKTAESYAAIASNQDQDGPGVRRCDEDRFCIDSLDAYVTYAKAGMAAGRQPDMVYAFSGTP